MRIPKNLKYFRYQLALLAEALPAGTPVFAAGMDKHLSPACAEILETCLGPTQRHRGKRKARLFSTQANTIGDETTFEPIDASSHFTADDLGLEIQALPNVFASDSLDQGTRFLLSRFEAIEPVERALDFGCGNGVLGLAAFQQGLASHVVFCDESAQAVESARSNTAHLFPGNSNAFSFHHGDGLEYYRDDKPQLILFNPPFHMGHTVDEFIGKRLLSTAVEHLATKGLLYVVANRHLNYPALLKRLAGNCEIIDKNAKFNLLRVRKTR